MPKSITYLKPGFVRMDFVSPHHGAVLAYDPGDGKVRLRPFGEHVPPALTLSPANPLVRDHNGHRVDRSDVGELLRNVQALQQGGATVTEGEETIGGRAALRVTVTGAPAHAVDGVHRYRLWLDADDGFPLKVVSFADGDGEPLETVTLDDVEIDVAFPARFSRPDSASCRRLHGGIPVFDDLAAWTRRSRPSGTRSTRSIAGPNGGGRGADRRARAGRRARRRRAAALYVEGRVAVPSDLRHARAARRAAARARRPRERRAIEGDGRWSFRGDGARTVVRYDWHIRTREPWMNWLAPVARPLFTWNHDVVMREGARGPRGCSAPPSRPTAGRSGRSPAVRDM
jgi:hypothetical protein